MVKRRMLIGPNGRVRTRNKVVVLSLPPSSPKQIYLYTVFMCVYIYTVVSCTSMQHNNGVVTVVLTVPVFKITSFYYC